jgi:hypothetical protein
MGSGQWSPGLGRGRPGRTIIREGVSPHQFDEDLKIVLWLFFFFFFFGRDLA